MTVHEVLMPRLSDTMTEGIVGKWLKIEGDTVAKGDAIAEIETDKVTVELEAPADGTLLRLLVLDGEAIPPGGVVALVGPDGAELPDGTQAAQLPARIALAPEPPRILGVAPTPTRVRATPLARRLAAEAGIGLASLGLGSGPNGRILRHDIERAAASSAGAARDEVIVPNRMQLATARRTTAAKQEIPHYYLDTTADVSRLLAEGLPVTACILRAAALSLREFPRVNGSWVGDTIVHRRAVNVGLAVAVDDEGLVVPVLKDADAKSLAEIAAGAAELIGKAREGRLSPEDVSGGSFTVSNLGMFGLDSFHAIINPPESGILTVGAVRRAPVVRGDEIVVCDVMQLSLSADHRVYSGATAAAFLAAVRVKLEQPDTLA